MFVVAFATAHFITVRRSQCRSQMLAVRAPIPTSDRIPSEVLRDRDQLSKVRNRLIGSVLAQSILGFSRWEPLDWESHHHVGCPNFMGLLDTFRERGAWPGHGQAMTRNYGGPVYMDLQDARSDVR